MKKFKSLIAEFQTNIVNFNLQFLVDRINELEACAVVTNTRSSQTVNKQNKSVEAKLDEKRNTMEEDITVVKSKDADAYSERYTSYYSSSINTGSSLKTSDRFSFNDSILERSFLTSRNVSRQHSYNLRTFTKQCQQQVSGSSLPTVVESNAKKSKFNSLESSLKSSTIDFITRPTTSSSCTNSIYLCI